MSSNYFSAVEPSCIPINSVEMSLLFPYPYQYLSFLFSDTCYSPSHRIEPLIIFTFLSLTFYLHFFSKQWLRILYMPVVPVELSFVKDSVYILSHFGISFFCFFVLLLLLFLLFSCHLCCWALYVFWLLSFGVWHINISSHSVRNLFWWWFFLTFYIPSDKFLFLFPFNWAWVI